MINVVRISSYGRDEKSISEKNFAASLADPETKIFQIDQKTKSDIFVNVSAIIRRDLLLRAQRRETQGLVQYGKEEGATSWALLSAPTGTYRALLHYYYDAFVMLTTYQSLQDWTLTLYNQDVRLLDGLKPAKVVNLLAGTELSEQKIQENIVQGLQEKKKKRESEVDELQKKIEMVTLKPAKAAVQQKLPEVKAPESKPTQIEKPIETKPVAEAPQIIQPAATPSVAAKEAGPSINEPAVTEEKWAVPPTGDIIIAGTFDLSRNAKNESFSYIAGMDLAFDQANESGGVRGRAIHLIVGPDDESDANKAYENVQELRKIYKTDLITGPMGASMMQGHLLDLIKQGEIVSVFPFMADPEVRRPSLKYVINYMPGTLQTFYPMLKYAFKKLGARKPAIVYTGDLPNADKNVETMMKGAEVIDYKPVPIGSADINFTEQIKTIDLYNPDMLVFLTYPTAAMKFIRAIKSKIHDKIIMVDASLVGKLFDWLLTEKVSRFVLGGAVPDPDLENLTIPIAKEMKSLKLYIIENFIKAGQKKGISIDSISLIGYISGKILVEILRKVDGVITKEKVIDAAASMKDIDLEGLPISYDPLRHQFGKYIFLGTPSETWVGKPFKQWTAIDVSKFPYFEAFLSPEDLAIKRQIEAEAKGVKLPVGPSVKNSKINSASLRGDKIKLASTMDFTDGLKDNSLLLKKSIESYFAEVNKTGGINGQPIGISFRDDEYEVPKAIANSDYFLNVLKINTFIAPTGTPTLESYLGRVKSGLLLVLFPLSGSDVFRTPDLTHIINFRSSYNRESYALAQYAVETLHAKKVVIFYQTTAPANEGALEYFKKVSFTNYFEVAYDEKATNFKEQIKKIEQENPDALILCAIQTAALGLLQEMGTFAKTLKLLGWSILSGDAFASSWRLSGNGIVIANVVPDPAAKSSADTKYPMQLIQSFQKFAKDYGIMPDTTAFEGYIDARLTAELYKQAKNDISNEKIIEFAEQMKNYPLDDLKLTFNPQTRELYNTIWIDSGKGEWMPYVFQELTTKPAQLNQ